MSMMKDRIHNKNYPDWLPHPGLSENQTPGGRTTFDSRLVPEENINGLSYYCEVNEREQVLWRYMEGEYNSAIETVQEHMITNNYTAVLRFTLSTSRSVREQLTALGYSTPENWFYVYRRGEHLRRGLPVLLPSRAGRGGL